MHRNSRFKIFDLRSQRPVEGDDPKNDHQSNADDPHALDNVATADQAGGYGDSSGFADQDTGPEL